METNLPDTTCITFCCLYVEYQNVQTTLFVISVLYVLRSSLKIDRFIDYCRYIVSRNRCGNFNPIKLEDDLVDCNNKKRTERFHEHQNNYIRCTRYINKSVSKVNISKHYRK